MITTRSAAAATTCQVARRLASLECRQKNGSCSGWLLRSGVPRRLGEGSGFSLVSSGARLDHILS